MLLIVGLGNPGKKYKVTRHNVGFMVIDELAKKLGVKFIKRKSFLYASATACGKNVILMKPNTYMNASGIAVNFFVHKKKIDLSQLLVICDDFNLPIGKIRLRGKGRDGGHNGLSSIISFLKTGEFPRLRIGIGSDFTNGDVVKFVLTSFKKNENKIIEKSVADSSEAVLSFIENGLDKTMTVYNAL